MSDWPTRSWGELASLEYGRALRGYKETDNEYRVFGTNGPIGWHDAALFPPGVIIGRKGAYRGVHYSSGPCWVIDTAYYLKIRNPDAVDPKWAYYQLRTVDLDSIDSGSAIPSTSRDAFDAIPVRLAPVSVQRRVVAVLDTIGDVIENSRQRMALLERMAQATYREWFVRFRYPGREDSGLVDSTLGPIPAGWSVRPLAELAAPERHAITSGPFGSKLGRKDYVEDGVPVIRGGNLKVGGGFTTTDVVFVSAEKANELKASVARPGDIVVTQRGTLGQVGLIPSSSRWPRYVLSQSQMKVTVDLKVTTAEFIYYQLRSSETTERFVGQAMTSGVPHVNLALLREFEVVAPPVEIARRFSDSICGLDAMRDVLSADLTTAVRLRDMLLPKLVTGAIDVLRLDLDELLNESAA